MKKFNFLILTIFFIYQLNAQSIKALNWAKNANLPILNGVKLQNNSQKSIASRVLYFPYIVYKYTVSSQDASACSFHPSCANYGLCAVQKKGLIGILHSFDRVSRCHGLYPSNYLIHPVYFINWDEIH